MTDGEEASQSRRCAVIYNPTKISDKFRALVEEGLQQRGWGDTLWLETSVEDPGGAITKQAVAAHVDLVIAAGGVGHEFDRRAATYNESEMHRGRPIRPSGCCDLNRLSAFWTSPPNRPGGPRLRTDHACVSTDRGNRRFSRHAAGCRSVVDEQLSASRCRPAALPTGYVRCAALHRRYSLLS
jgi:hypothetical protein